MCTLAMQATRGQELVVLQSLHLSVGSLTWLCFQQQHLNPKLKSLIPKQAAVGMAAV